MILTYFLPIGSMTFTYARVGLELWGSQSIGEATARQLENIRSKRRVCIKLINLSAHSSDAEIAFVPNDQKVI